MMTDVPMESHQKSVRHSKSCQRCRRRKQRCHGFPICSNCQAAKKTCIQSEFAIELHKSSPESAAFERIRILEERLAASLAREELYKERTLTQTPQNAAESPPIQQPEPRDRESFDRNRAHSSSSRIADTVGFLSLGDSISGEPTYVGSSSGFSLAANLGQLVQATVWRKALASTFAEDRPFNVADLKESHCGFPDDKMGVQIVKMYFDKVHQRYPFLDRNEMLNLHARRHQLTSSSPQDQYNIFKLYMIYAIGSTLLQLTQTYTYTSPEKYFITAMQYISAARESHSIHNAEAMILLVLYNLRSPSNSGIWYMIGLAVRTSIDLGMHREAHYSNLTPYQSQLRRRLFWSVYLLDRVIAISLGRPVNISDQDIDVELPLDIDDSVTSSSQITASLNQARRQEPPGIRLRPTTNLTMWTELVKLKRIESQIQCHIYRVDMSITSLFPEVQPLLLRLEEWKALTPQLTTAENNYLTLLWNKATRLLIQPFLGMLDPNDQLVKKCLTASGQICQIFKRMFQQDSYGHSFISVHSIFIAGVNICYCLCLNPSLWTMTTANDLRACSSALFVMAERTPRVKKYRDVLETVISSAMDFITKSTSEIQEQEVTTLPQQANGFSQHEHQAVQSLLGLSSAPQVNSTESLRSTDASNPPRQGIYQRPSVSNNQWQHLPSEQPFAQMNAQDDISNWPMESLLDFQWQNDYPSNNLMSVPESAHESWSTGELPASNPDQGENVWAGDRYGLHMINKLLSMDANGQPLNSQDT